MRGAIQAQKSLVFEEANRLRDGEGGNTDLVVKRRLEYTEERRMLEKAIGEYSESTGLCYASMVCCFQLINTTMLNHISQIDCFSGIFKVVWFEAVIRSKCIRP